MAVETPINERIKASADPRVLHPLDQLRGTIRRFVLLDGLLAAGLLLVVWFWAGLVFDFGLFRLTGFDWVQDAPAALRAVALVVMLGLLVLVVVTRVLTRVRREFSYPSLALVLEKRFPRLLGDRLITAVELADVNRAAKLGYSAEMIRLTIDEAREAVAQVPVATVFNWWRLRSKAILIGGIVFGAVIVSYLLFALLARTFAPGEFAWRFGDVLSIYTERTLLLKNVPWPRRAHLELVAFPGDDLRVGKEAPPPKIRARAFQYVVAEPVTADRRTGWRPFLWSDLASHSEIYAPRKETPLTVTLNHEEDWRAKDVARAAVVGGPGFPAEKPVSTEIVALNDLAVDEVAERFAPSHPEIAEVLAQLDEVAARPSMSRTFRKLDLPDTVRLYYTGRASGTGPAARFQGRTRGDIPLTREPTGEYVAEVTGLKESVSFTVRAADFRTSAKDITLVPAPALTKLSHLDYQPAYLFHPAPEEAVKPGPDGKRPPPSWTALKGLRQAMPEKDLSLTGEKSVCTVPAGTELVLTAVADKPLKAARLIPKSGRIPGSPKGATAAVPIAPDGDQIVIRFEGEYRVAESVEFDLEFSDPDDVKSTRSVLIQAVEDLTPQVEVAVDILRKVGNSYYCTPRARVPFVKESIIRDDTGLSRVEFQFTVSRVEAQAVVGLQLQALASIWAAAPLVPNIGSVVLPPTGVSLASQLSKGEAKQFAAMPVTAFERAYDALVKDTPSVLRDKLGRPPANPDATDTVKEVKFTNEADVFDLADADALLEAQGKRMLVADSGEIQPRFRVELSVVARDVNIETGPKEARNLDPIRLLVVSEADLLAEITKDEEILIGKFDAALKNLREAEAMLADQTARLAPSTVAPDVLLSARVKADSIIMEVGKAREFTQVVATEYGRLKRETEVNRCNESVPRRYDSAIIKPLEAVLANQFKAAEDGLTGFRDPLGDDRRPDDAAIATARVRLTALISELTRIRAGLGEALSESKLRDELRKIIDNQTLVTRALKRIYDGIQISLFAPTIKPVPPVMLAQGEKKTVKHVIDWNVFDKGEIKVRVEPQAGSEIQGPGELTVKDDKNDFEYEITAGKKAGEFTVKLTPTVGEPVIVKIVVK
ncbi:hypothetical protein [Fimbriiglobus ruber]|uniref:Polyketide synthase n=1 Tax=Fimbriiglobus ruber TaxID=1908690 RepID=A0A225DSM2_9BACT|nr:hypothetical protein [Fimbriiglobus ruber]OWK44311.1 polyketide synthase [Fimbriiglobus ruber]